MCPCDRETLQQPCPNVINKLGSYVVQKELCSSTDYSLLYTSGVILPWCPCWMRHSDCMGGGGAWQWWPEPSWPTCWGIVSSCRCWVEQGEHLYWTLIPIRMINLPSHPNGNVRLVGHSSHPLSHGWLIFIINFHRETGTVFIQK